MHERQRPKPGPCAPGVRKLHRTSPCRHKWQCRGWADRSSVLRRRGPNPSPPSKRRATWRALVKERAPSSTVHSRPSVGSQRRPAERLWSQRCMGASHVENHVPRSHAEPEPLCLGRRTPTPSRPRASSRILRAAVEARRSRGVPSPRLTAAFAHRMVLSQACCCSAREGGGPQPPPLVQLTLPAATAGGGPRAPRRPANSKEGAEPPHAPPRCPAASLEE